MRNIIFKIVPGLGVGFFFLKRKWGYIEPLRVVLLANQ
jgi:hypothetical protein